MRALSRVLDFGRIVEVVVGSFRAGAADGGRFDSAGVDSRLCRTGAIQVSLLLFETLNSGSY